MISMYQLQIFLSVVEQGSFSSAAEELHLTQPAISMQIRALEERYGVKLFSRIGQRIELTEAGRSLVDPARRLLLQAQTVEEHFSAELGELRGRINIAYSRNCAAVIYNLPRVLASFREKHNRVHFFLQQLDDDDILQRLQEREINFGVISTRPRQKGLELHNYMQDELMVAVPIGHLWTGKRIKVSELKGYPFILRTTGSETRRVGEMILRAAGLTYNDLQIVTELDSAEGVALAAEQGLGCGFITQSIGRRFADNGKLALVGIDLTVEELESGVELLREINIIRVAPNSERQPAPTQERFWEFLLANKV